MTWGGAPAEAANVGFAQCSNVGPGPGGATTEMTCSVTIVNTIDGATRGSTVTVARQCSLDPCPGGNQSATTTSSSDLITSVSQCNGSGNDAAHTTTCTVRITNNISSDTPGATPVRGVTVNQCNSSAQGGGGSNTCDPFPATTTSADVAQCNGSANGGGGTIDCDVPPGGTVSGALPITVDQCNGTGNPGGSTVRCSTSITTNITSPSSGGTTGGTTGSGGSSGGPTTPPATTATPTASPTATPTATGTAPGGTPRATRGTGASPGAPGGSSGGQQVLQVPLGGVDAGGGSTALHRVGTARDNGIRRTLWLSTAGLAIALLAVRRRRPVR